ncbi:MAG: hypothetical protein R2865_08730 [Deinococcales bacterium]
MLLALAGRFSRHFALDELKRIIDETKPKLVIPMHFRTLCYIPGACSLSMSSCAIF